MKISDKEILGLIPARRGSKSIPLKNIVPLNGYPLIAYVINAARKCTTIQRIICSTDSEEISTVCSKLGVEIVGRAKHLARDETHIVDVVIDFVHTLHKNDGYIPFAIALLQPTSPFVLPEHIDRCVELLQRDSKAGSSQTISRIPHNFHAYNQRVVENNCVRFQFSEERNIYYNKQLKPKFYMFGNLVVIKTKALLESREIFPQPSLACEIPFFYALDIDGSDDVDLAEFYLQHGKVLLPKM